VGIKMERGGRQAVLLHLTYYYDHSQALKEDPCKPPAVAEFI